MEFFIVMFLGMVCAFLSLFLTKVLCIYVIFTENATIKVKKFNIFNHKKAEKWGKIFREKHENNPDFEILAAFIGYMPKEFHDFEVVE